MHPCISWVKHHLMKSSCEPSPRFFLTQGGVTPSLGDIEASLSALQGFDTRLHLLVRPRPGDFVYTAAEKEVRSKTSPYACARRQGP